MKTILFRFVYGIHSIFRFTWSIDQRNEKNQPSFSGKMRIFYTENKQTGQPIFSLLIVLTKKQKME